MEGSGGTQGRRRTAAKQEERSETSLTPEESRRRSRRPTWGGGRRRRRRHRAASRPRINDRRMGAGWWTRRGAGSAGRAWFLRTNVDSKSAPPTSRCRDCGVKAWNRSIVRRASFGGESPFDSWKSASVEEDGWFDTNIEVPSGYSSYDLSELLRFEWIKSSKMTSSTVNHLNRSFQKRAYSIWPDFGWIEKKNLILLHDHLGD